MIVPLVFIRSKKKATYILFSKLSFIASTSVIHKYQRGKKWRRIVGENFVYEIKVFSLDLL